MSPLMDKHGLAELLNVPVGWVEKATAARDVPITWVGKHARYDPADIAAWIAERKEGPLAAPPALSLVRRGHPPAGPSTPSPPSGPPRRAVA